MARFVSPKTLFASEESMDENNKQQNTPSCETQASVVEVSASDVGTRDVGVTETSSGISVEREQKDADCGRAARIKITLNPKRIGSSAKLSLLYEKELGESREISSLLRKNCHSYTVIPY